VLGFNGAPQPYVDALRQRGIVWEGIDATSQTAIDAGIRAVAEGREAREDTEAARTAVGLVRARGVDAVILGCTEIPLLLGDESNAQDLISPAAVLAAAAVRFAIAQAPVAVA
jgi:aspartate racemase